MAPVLKRLATALGDTAGWYPLAWALGSRTPEGPSLLCRKRRMNDHLLHRRPQRRVTLLGDLQSQVLPGSTQPVSRIPYNIRTLGTVPGEPRLLEKSDFLDIPEIRFPQSALRALGEDGVREGTFKNTRRRVNFFYRFTLCECEGYVCVCACVMGEIISLWHNHATKH